MAIAKIIKYIFCITLALLSTLYIVLIFSSPNYDKCDKAISTYYENQNKSIRVTTPIVRKCNLYYQLKLRSYFLNDNKASFYLYKISTRFHSDKYYWLYISAMQGNKEAQELITKGNIIDWTSDN